jgi:hypothetical protein
MSNQPTSDIGSTGLQESWGQIRDDFLREWRGAEKVKRVDEMLKNSPVIGALRLAIEMPIRGISWEFTSEEGEDDPRLELLNAARANLSHSWNDHIVEALLFPFYGWSVFSITYERAGGQMLWRKFKMLGHDTIERWLFEEDGGLKGLRQFPYYWKEEIPIERCILYRFRRNRNNPEGESILRPAWTSWYYAKNLQQNEAIGIERNLSGLPVITPPMGTDMTESTSETTPYGRAHAIVRNVRNDQQAGIVLPPPTGDGEHQRWHFDLMASSGSGKTVDTDMVIGRYEKRILMSALAQFLILGQDGVGAFSLSQDQTDFFTMSVNSIADIISETFSKFAIPRLCELNGVDHAGLTLEHTPAGDINTAMLADTLQKVAPFITWESRDEVWLRSVLDLPSAEAEELDKAKEVRRQQAASTASFLFPPRQEQPPMFNQDGMMRSTRFAATAASDEDERRKFERRFGKQIGSFLAEQKQRVIKGAKGLRRG